MKKWQCESCIVFHPNGCSAGKNLTKLMAMVSNSRTERSSYEPRSKQLARAPTVLGQQNRHGLKSASRCTDDVTPDPLNPHSPFALGPRQSRGLTRSQGSTPLIGQALAEQQNGEDQFDRAENNRNSE